MVYKNIPAALTLNWTDGFLLKPFASTTYAFTYTFSQLKGSSDDGNATLTLMFQDTAGSNNLEEQVNYSAHFCKKKKMHIIFFFLVGDNLPKTPRTPFQHARLSNRQSGFS